MRKLTCHAIDLLENRHLLTGDLAGLLTISGFGADAVADAAFDASGALYIAGRFRGPVRFGAGPAGRQHSAGGTDAFVAKYAPSGRLAWVRRFGSTGDDRAVSLCVDAAGNVLVAGDFAQTVDFDPSHRSVELRSRGREDVFVMRLDPRGRLLWARAVGGSGRDLAAGIATDALENAYITGRFSRRADLDPGPAQNISVSAGGYDGFLLALDAAGSLLFARTFGGAGHDLPADIAADIFGNTLVAGSFTGTCRFAAADRSVSLTSAGGADIFAARFAFDGRLIDVMSAGGPLHDRASGAALDGRGGMYIAGTFAGQVDFQPGEGNTPATSTGAGADAFVARYTASFALDYVKIIGGPAADEARCMAVDAAGAIYVAGTWQGTADFDPGAGVFNMSSPAGSSAFLVKLAASGRFAYARAFGGNGRTVPLAVAVSADGDLALCGEFAGPADFDPGAPQRPARSSGPSDGFAARLSQRLPSFSFTRTVGTTGAATINAIAADAGDFLCLAGSFADTLGFAVGAGSIDFTSAGGSDVFVGKFCNKCVITWGRSLGGAGDDAAVAAALDADGSMIVAGTFTGTVDFDPGPGSFELTARGMDVFVLKLDAQGRFAWAAQLGGAGNDRPAALAVRGDRIYVTGSFEGTADFDPGPQAQDLSSAGGTDIFIAALDADGNLLWARRIGGGGDDVAAAMALDPSGNLCITGTFSGQADFDPGPGVIPLVAGAAPQVYVLKMSAAGEAMWARGLGGIYEGDARAISVAGDGSILAAGSFAGHLIAGANTLASGDGSAAYLAKLSPAGAVSWAQAFTGNSVSAAAVAADPAGNIVLAGHFAGSMPGAQLASDGGNDVFILRMDRDGAPIWAGRMGGAGDDRATAAIVAGSGAFVYVMGTFAAAGDFDPTDGVAELAGHDTAPGTFITRIVF